MTTPASLDAIAVHWAGMLGCTPDDLDGAALLVCPHASHLADYWGCLVLSRGPALIASLPGTLAASYAPRLAATPGLFSVTALEDIFGDLAEMIIGPAWLGYADATDFRPVDAAGVRLLETRDEQRIRALRLAVGEEAWAHSGIHSETEGIMGYIEGGRLLAAGRLEARGHTILDVGIVTDPAWRGRGLGRKVVSALTAAGLARGKIMQYRTLLANQPSMAIARSLGYSPYAATLAVRFRRVGDIGALAQREAEY